MPVLTIDKKPYSQDLNTPDRLEIEKWEKELTALEETLLSIAGHELRTPLTVVKALGELLQQNLSKQLQAGSNPLELEALTTRNLSYLARLLYQLDRIEVLINQWLDRDSLKQTRFTHAKSYSFNLVDLVKRVVEQHKLIAFQHSFTVKEPSEVVTVRGTEELVEQILNNLIQNALKHSPPGSAIEIGLTRKAIYGRETEEADHHVVVWVKDEGPGIPEETQSYLFEAFYRAAKAPSASNRGLGLYICRHLIQRLGGQIWLESQPGEGSTFYFSLPQSHPETH